MEQLTVFHSSVIMTYLQWINYQIICAKMNHVFLDLYVAIHLNLIQDLLFSPLVLVVLCYAEFGQLILFIPLIMESWTSYTNFFFISFDSIFHLVDVNFFVITCNGRIVLRWRWRIMYFMEMTLIIFLFAVFASWY